MQFAIFGFALYQASETRQLKSLISLLMSSLIPSADLSLNEGELLPRACEATWPAIFIIFHRNCVFFYIVLVLVCAYKVSDKDLRKFGNTTF